MLVKNILPSDNERVLLELDNLKFKSVPMDSQSQHLSDDIFYVQKPKVDSGESSVGDEGSSNSYFMKELNNF